MRSLLVTGASGFLGWHTCRLLAADWSVVGTYHHHPVTLEDGTVLSLDLNDDASLEQCWQAAHPTAVIHTAAISKVNQCQQDPEGSFRVNVTGAVKLAQRCAEADIPFIFTSTDFVFDGTQAPYAETDRPAPLQQYGQQKAIAEAEILTVHPNATICRLPLLYGPATPTATCFLQGFLAAIAAGNPLTLFTDEYRTPAAVTDVVQGFQRVLKQGITGHLHLGGPQRLNRFEFGLLMAEAFQFPTTALQPCLRADVPLPAPRPADVSLNSQRAFSLGYAPRPIAPALQAIAQGQRMG